MLPYYKRWMERWPTVEALAEAPIEDVLHVWQGLGYYNRARKLHAGAKVVVERYGGLLPADVEPVSYTHLDVYKRQCQGGLSDECESGPLCFAGKMCIRDRSVFGLCPKQVKDETGNEFILFRPLNQGGE